MTEIINYSIVNKIITLESISVKFEQKDKIKLIEGDLESNELLIFQSIMHILYQIICKNGIRDIDEETQNKCIINLAYLIKYYDNPTELQQALLKRKSRSSSYDAFMLLIKIFNEILLKKFLI